VSGSTVSCGILNPIKKPRVLYGITPAPQKASGDYPILPPPKNTQNKPGFSIPDGIKAIERKPHKKKQEIDANIWGKGPKIKNADVSLLITPPLIKPQ
jgi:hypothetical protein